MSTRGKLVDEVFDRIDAMRLTGEEKIRLIDHLASHDPEIAHAGLDSIERTRRRLALLREQEAQERRRLELLRQQESAS